MNGKTRPHFRARHYDSSNSTEDSSSTSTDTSSTTDSSTTSDSSSSDSSDDTGLIVGLVLGLIGFLVLVGLGIWLYMKWKQKKIIKDYTMNPETFLAPQKLSIGQKMKLKRWNINKDPKLQIPDFTCKTVDSILGSYLQLTFKQEPGVFLSVIGEVAIDVEKENSYFEIEIEDLPINKENLIVLGFAVDTDFVKTFVPGTYPNSVGFQSTIENCEVMMNNKSMIAFEFAAVYGETLGIGIRGKDRRIWLSHNGSFLNPPAPSERVLTEKELKKKEAELQKMDQEIAKEIKEKEAKQEQEAIKKKVVFQTQKKKFFPVVGSRGPCILNLNVGGLPFRMFQKETALGLL